MLACVLASTAALLPDAPRSGRRAVLRGAASAAMLPSIAWAQSGVPEGMKTSESYAASPATPCRYPRPARPEQRPLSVAPCPPPRHSLPPPSARRYTNLQQISPETTGTLGAGTMSSRSRPAVLTRNARPVPGPPYCTYGLRVPASRMLYVPKAQGSLPRAATAVVSRYAVRTSLGRAVP